MRRLLAAELRNYSRALRKNLTMGAPEDESFSIGRIQRNLFESLSSDLGLLKPGEIDVVVNAIISFRGMNHFLENWAFEHTATRYLLPVQTWEEYAEMASTVADAFDLAIEAIELSEDS